MDLIYSNEKFNNVNELINDLNDPKKSDGFQLEITMNESGEIILYENSENQMTLENILKNLNLNNKKITLNLKKYLNIPITDENIEEISFKNEYFIKTLLEKIKNYQNINHIASDNYHFIYFLEKYKNKEKIGIFLSKENYNFLDVDFYIIPLILYKDNFINELLNQNKEIYISINAKEINNIKSIINDENILKKLKFIVTN